jgi:hypothetical protein
MLLENTTKEVYLNAKNNLVCTTDWFEPRSVLKDLKKDLSIEDEVARGVMSIRQLSLLRNQLKADLAIYGQTYEEKLTRHERGFLVACGVDLNAEPWKKVGDQVRKEKVEQKAEPGQPLGVVSAPSAGSEPPDDPLRALRRLAEAWLGR